MDNGRGDKGQNNGNQNGRVKIPVVPEANAGWVLIPFFGTVLLYWWRQFSHAKAAKNRVVQAFYRFCFPLAEE
jgi:hypothetical protein